MNRTFNSQKALEAMVYVAQSQHDLYAALKAIYFADKEHLRLYGRQMFNEQYAALEFGPTPSALYDFVKRARGEQEKWFSQEQSNAILDALAATKRTINAKRVPNLDFLSISEIQCLDYGLMIVASKNMDQIIAHSHDPAYEKTNRNCMISLDDIIGTLPNAELVMEYLKG